ncbi:Ppx/GppA family phosphatase [Rhodopila sp.]|jgi:exopolyphosphatase/guanosine-5'-triphosphate,3'-diphosphate pyrophosphatase|uniref:Ppx/GppA family phosphatase n=1 Tax=Rhodopila sp. TaxID=2480087 RepID=UPI002D0A361A|nr:Ppx/GppA family phosphatase [Rhodopila sp.]HVZ09598.1 Ppx/GppA family phosphatase [Rhodopila sp.]
MPVTSAIPPHELPRCGVVDLGSNSVRLVVYEGRSRNPMPIFNEKAVLRLGRGLDATGRLNEEGVEQALTVMHRYCAVARAMGADPFEVLATAAVRDAVNGRAFIEILQQRMPEVPIHILSGAEEAAFSADGMLCGIPTADGILADIGGGSLELVRLDHGTRGPGHTLRLGVIRLAERSDGDTLRARVLAETDLRTVPWLGDAPGSDLYLVGGAFRALARIHIAQTGYPLAMVHHYTVGREEARDLAGLISTAPRKVLEKLPAAPRRRIDDLPYAAVVLRRLLRLANPRRVVFSASGLREGWFMRRMPPEIRLQDPLMAAARDMAEHLGRDMALPLALLRWTAPLFPTETADWLRLREVACWMSDIGSREHPEFRAEQSFLRVLRQPGIGLDHHARAFLALTIALRYEVDIDAPFLRPARSLLDVAAAARAEVLGVALRLAYTLSAGTRDLLAGTRLRVENGQLTLLLRENSGVFAGESVIRRLGRLAQVMGLEAAASADMAEAAE